MLSYPLSIFHRKNIRARTPQKFTPVHTDDDLRIFKKHLNLEPKQVPVSAALNSKLRVVTNIAIILQYRARDVDDYV